jgi:tetratricopeptide (TPR) repeat protein
LTRLDSETIVAMTGDWDEQIEAVYATADERTEEETLAAVLKLCDERPPDDPAALFERAGAYDYVGREAEAEPLYRQALAAGLAGDRRTQAVIQLASTLRNLGRAGEGAALLTGEVAAAPADDGYADARAAFLALTLLDSGRPDEAVGWAVRALAGHMKDYRRALTYYAEELLDRS